MKHPMMYIFINKSLHMSSGKIAAQAAHAAVMGTLISGEESRKDWLESKARTMIILEARDENHFINIGKYLQERGYDTHVVIDEGVNEIDPHSPTAMTTPIMDSEDEVMRDVFRQFNLYKDEIKVTFEVER